VDQPIARPVNREVMDKRRSLRNASDNLLDIHRKAAGHLRSAGYPISEQRLAKLAVTGDGPEYRRWGSRVLYDPTLLMK
jgi:hypothetical protein